MSSIEIGKKIVEFTNLCELLNIDHVKKQKTISNFSNYSICQNTKTKQVFLFACFGKKVQWKLGELKNINTIESEINNSTEIL
jgi:hypothetical protein